MNNTKSNTSGPVTDVEKERSRRDAAILSQPDLGNVSDMDMAARIVKVGFTCTKHHVRGVRYKHGIESTMAAPKGITIRNKPNILSPLLRRAGWM